MLLLQGLAAALALGSGPWHRHAPAPVTLASIAFAHPAQAQARTPAHSHATALRHHHDAFEAAMAGTIVAEGALDLHAFALTAAMSLLALGALHAMPGPGVHVMQATLGWRWSTRSPKPPFKPPRAG